MYETKDAAQCFDVTCSNMGDWCRSLCGSLKSRSTWWYSPTATAPENANKKLQEEMDTKNLTEAILKDLDSITKYNIKQLMDYLNKNQVLRQILVLKQNLIKEKFDVNAEVEEKDDIIEQNIIEKDEFNGKNEDETSLNGNMHIFNERKLNVKDFNAEEGVLRQEARYLSRNIEYDHTTQYVNLEDTVIKMFPEPHSRNPRLLTYRRQELVNSTIET